MKSYIQVFKKKPTRVVVGNNHAWNDGPIIGDHVGLTMGCKLIGGMHIGNHVTVASNSAVVKDFLIIVS